MNGSATNVVSAASWGFLELVHELEVGVYQDLPRHLGYSPVPTWWPLPWLALAGALTALAIARLPGRGGHVPAEGLKTGGAPTQPVELPGILLAATATLGLGLVLGPEAPLIALGMGLGIWAMRLVRRDSPEQALAVMAAAGSFAAVSAIFGSPVIGAVRPRRRPRGEQSVPRSRAVALTRWRRSCPPRQTPASLRLPAPID